MAKDDKGGGKGSRKKERFPLKSSVSITGFSDENPITKIEVEGSGNLVMVFAGKGNEEYHIKMDRKSQVEEFIQALSDAVRVMQDGG